MFSIGSNDPGYIEYKNNIIIPKSQLISNIKKFIEISKKYTDKIIFTELIQINNNITLPWIANEYWNNEDMVEYDNIIENICKEKNIDFIPLIDLLDIIEDLEDGLHPNTKGHKKIYKRVKEFLENKII